MYGFPLRLVSPSNIPSPVPSLLLFLQPPVLLETSYNHIVGRSWVYYKKVMFVGYLEGVRVSRDRQSYYSQGVHLVSTETNKGGFEWTKSL